MTALGLRAYDGESHELRVFPLTGEAPAAISLRVRGLPGASAVHLELVSGDEACRRFEVEVDGDEVIVVHLERAEDGRLDAWSQGREVLSLPPDRRYAPPLSVVAPTCPRQALDLAILVDGTTRSYGYGVEGSHGTNGGPAGEPEVRSLLADEEAKGRHVDLLVKIAEGLAEEADLRAGVFAFGDHVAADLRAPGLRPAYELHPRDGSGWKLGTLSLDELRATLLALPPTSGGDFVDALADALDILARLPWRDGARRLVLLSGDSPGYSILHPAPPGANLLPRRLDVDTRALALHRLGVEIVTLYQGLPGEARAAALNYERTLLEYAELQYRGLASRPDLAFEASGAEASAVIRRILDGPRALARGPGYGVLLVSPGGAS